MYERSRRRGGRNRPADVRDRRVPAGLREGPYRAVLRRHGRDATRAAGGTSQERAEFARTLFPLAVHPSNLKCAIDHLASEGGDAPGPDGVRPRDLDEAGRWKLARATSKAIKAGTYRPGAHREVKIAKGPGRGFRTLKLQDARDRAVQRAIVQAIQPFLDSMFSANSFGFRPRQGREHALAKAEALTMGEDRRSWVLEDVRDAFEQVPHGRLLEVLRHHDIPRDILDLIAVVIKNDAGRGLRQGGSLSPLLLNLYLHHHLDKPWEEAHPETPLIRYADDLLVLGQTRGEALWVKPALARLLDLAEMPLKESILSTTRDLGDGDACEWLGYDICRGESGLIVRLTSNGWDRLDEGLALAHTRNESPHRAFEIILGWIDQLGPCFLHLDVEEIYARVASIARGHGFHKLPTLHAVWDLWFRSAGRWEQLRERERIADEKFLIGGFATNHFRPVNSGRPGGVPSSVAPSRTANPGRVADEEEQPPDRPARTDLVICDHELDCETTPRETPPGRARSRRPAPAGAASPSSPTATVPPLRMTGRPPTTNGSRTRLAPWPHGPHPGFPDHPLGTNTMPIEADTELEFHDVTKKYRLMSEREFDGLKADIKANGQRAPIRTYQGKIVDGRHRYRACHELGITPLTEEWDGVGELMAFVDSMNHHRRHLSANELAMKAAGRASRRRGRPAKNAPIGAITLDEAAAEEDVSKKQVERFRKIQEKGVPGLAEAVARGEVRLTAAAEVAGLSAEEQTKVVAGGAKDIKAKAAEMRREKKVEGAGRKAKESARVDAGDATAEDAKIDLNRKDRPAVRSGREEPELTEEVEKRLADQADAETTTTAEPLATEKDEDTALRDDESRFTLPSAWKGKARELVVARANEVQERLNSTLALVRSSFLGPMPDGLSSLVMWQVMDPFLKHFIELISAASPMKWIDCEKCGPDRPRSSGSPCRVCAGTKTLIAPKVATPIDAGDLDDGDPAVDREDR